MGECSRQNDESTRPMRSDPATDEVFLVRASQLIPKSTTSIISIRYFTGKRYDIRRNMLNKYEFVVNRVIMI